MTLKVTSNQVNSVQGVPISVTGIAQVLIILIIFIILCLVPFPVAKILDCQNINFQALIIFNLIYNFKEYFFFGNFAP